ncbi:hypothetical protein EG328_002337 [Venturia inaequalis]|uniref:Uncharacterized protein n=2 Tax=Venturia inaequalis TaxID=5025 RepID=A0A8H3YX25_VENIN|nr:hypothetical protein EG328_002337 [Venturia inaequalis]
MGPRMKRSSPTAGRQSVLSFATVEEKEASPPSKYNISDTITFPERPISRIQSAPVLKSHEILAGYEAVTRNKSLELCPPDRPPPPVPRWANSRAPKPVPPPKPVALRSNSTPILLPSVPSPEGSIEAAPQVFSPSKEAHPVVPVLPKETVDEIQPVATSPLQSPTPENLPFLEEPRKRKSYRHSFTTRFKRLMPKHRSNKRLTKTSASIATATTNTTRPDLDSFFTPFSKPQDSEKLMLGSAMVLEKNQDEIHVFPEGSTSSIDNPVRREKPSPSTSASNLTTFTHNDTDALVVRLPNRTSFLNQASSVSPATPHCLENIDTHSPTSPISAHANLYGVEDISKISSAYCHPSATQLPFLKESIPDPINILAAVLKSGLNPASSTASENASAVISRNFAMGDPASKSLAIQTSQVLPKASPLIPPRPLKRHRKQRPVPDTTPVIDVSTSAAQLPAGPSTPPTREQAPARATVSTSQPSTPPTRDQIPGPAIASACQPLPVASPSDNIYFVHPIKPLNQDISNRNMPLDQRKWQRLPYNTTDETEIQQPCPPAADVHNLNNLAARNASLGGPQAASWLAVKSGVKTNRVEFYQPDGVIVWTPPGNLERREERVWA